MKEKILDIVCNSGSRRQLVLGFSLGLILAALVVGCREEYPGGSAESQAQVDLKILKSALEEYVRMGGDLPTGDADFSFLLDPPTLGASPVLLRLPRNPVGEHYRVQTLDNRMELYTEIQFSEADSERVSLVFDVHGIKSEVQP